ncbi:AAA domain-containing protein [Fusarium sp. LHS14.1]|nr:AAA domain-containing protein [Fusarium sp. LHS14.1]
MSNSDPHDTHQGLHDNLDQKHSPFPEPADLPRNDEIQNTETKQTQDSESVREAKVEVFYEESCSDGKYHWTIEPPPKIPKETANVLGRADIKVFKIKDHDKFGFSGEYPMKAYRVEVQDPLLVGALAPILRKENVHLDPVAVAVFKEPFYPLYFRNKEIIDLWNRNQGDDVLRPLLEAFVNVLIELFRGLKAKTDGLQGLGLINFKIAWTLFPRDSTVYGRSLNSEFVGKVDSIKYEGCPGERRLLITCKTISASGGRFFWERRTLTIPEFTGSKPIHELRCCRLWFRRDKELITERLTARGRKVLGLQRFEHCTYNGIVVRKTDSTTLRRNVNSRIVIDPQGYDKYYLNQGQREINDPEKDWMVPTLEELIFMSETVSGFSLKDKLWFQFFVEDIQLIDWHAEAYSDFVFDEQKKELVLSLVLNHNMNNSTSRAMQDVIVDKGKGLIVMLSGPSGTGKTLMAEAIADHLHRPLYRLEAKDLGTQAASLGTNFKRVSELTTAWNAIILLDEAEVFMAPREPGHVSQNDLSSAFLRELEYFSGIIFLTTPTIKTGIDSAFRGRASVHLVFPPFTQQTREKVWSMFLNRLSQQRRRISDGREDVAPDEPNDEPYAMSVNENDIAQLALWGLNGREIKAAIQIVHNWCCNKNYEMTLARLEYGIRLVSPFCSKDMGVFDDSG